LVITDLTMPALNGVELGQQMLQIKPGLSIILTSDYSGVMTA
jgi:YesN/AraC family two-component response regulator